MIVFMSAHLEKLFLFEQQAFLSRRKAGWDGHLEHIHAFLGQGLQQADPAHPVLILGAGSGLEVPWELAPKHTVGWDFDPFSRWRTLFRHRRFAPWVNGDISGALHELRAAIYRAVRETWSGRRRNRQAAILRLIALLDSLTPEPRALREWLQRCQPGSILAANFMGQIEPTAHKLIENAFAPLDPWESDPEKADPLLEALQRWTGRTIVAFLCVMKESGAALWLVHDRAVMDMALPVRLGAFEADWRAQLQCASSLEVYDPLGGVDVLAELGNHATASRGDAVVCENQSMITAILPTVKSDFHGHAERWLWPVAEDQLHLMEAISTPARTV